MVHTRKFRNVHGPELFCLIYDSVGVLGVKSLVERDGNMYRFRDVFDGVLTLCMVHLQIVENCL